MPIPSVCHMLGYAREELVGLHASAIVVPAETPHIDPALDAIKAGRAYHPRMAISAQGRHRLSADVMATKMPRRQPAWHDPRRHRAPGGRAGLARIERLLEVKVPNARWKLQVLNKELEASAIPYRTISGRPCAALPASPRSWRKTTAPRSMKRPAAILGAYSQRPTAWGNSSTICWIFPAFPARALSRTR